MDPLSVTAAVFGILGAAAKISSALYSFINNTKSAPKLAQAVLSEITGTTTVLSQLQQFLLGQSVASKSRASLILVEQVVVTLTECVTTFSELEGVLGTSKPDTEVTGLDRVRWARKESKISAVLTRLQSNKSTMTLMLTILQCRSMDEAESAMDRLCNLVEQVLASNQEMSRRLRALDGEQVAETTTGRGNRRSIDEQSAPSTTSDKEQPAPPREIIQRNARDFAFEEELLASRVYKRPLYSQSGESLVTSAARTTASSILSALSMSDVSNIAILAVPIYANEISNSKRYIFGDFTLDTNVTGDIHTQHPLTSQSSPKSRRWDLFSNAIKRSRKVESPNKRAELHGVDAESSNGQQADATKTVLGVPLSIIIEYAGSVINRTNEEGELYEYGRIPIFVAQTGLFLKENGREVPDLFSVSGSPKRLKALESAFNSPPYYCKKRDWSGYTVHDAANIMIRFLSQMPEPVIPVDLYEKFLHPLRNYPEETLASFYEKVQREQLDLIFEHGMPGEPYLELVRALPPLQQQLFHYLMDILRCFGLDFTTSARLSAIFQPVILSPVRRDEDYIEDPVYRRLSQVVVQFLIWHSDSLLDFMTRPVADSPLPVDTSDENATDLQLAQKSEDDPDEPDRHSLSEESPSDQPRRRRWKNLRI